MKIQILASGSSGNAYIIGDGETSLLLDAGIPLKAIQTGSGFRVRQLAGCFITHSHKDHSKAAKDLARLGVDIHQRGNHRSVRAVRPQDTRGKSPPGVSSWYVSGAAL